jgi:hypothetical protein
MWAIYKVNVLRAMKSGKYGKDPETFAAFLANEYDKCIKRGGDMLYGVPVINGNIIGMTDVIKRALIKGQNSGGENFNLLQEIYPSAFDAYWNGAEMAPMPNPLLRPLGWPMTPPAPGTIMNIGPNPISLAQSAAKQTAIKAAMKVLVDKLKQQTVDIPNAGTINIGETIDKIKKGEPIDKNIKNHPAIKAGMSVYAKYEQAKKMKPGCGSQFKPAVKFPFPELPKRSKLIEAAKKKLKDEALKVLKTQLEAAAKELIVSTLTAGVFTTLPIAVQPFITQDIVKKYISDKIDGKATQWPTVPSRPDIPTISEPTIPTKEELQKKIKEKIPTEQELSAMAEASILGKIPKIPNVFFVPPTPVFSPSTNLLINPFVNVARLHLMGTGGTMMVMAQYPPPAPPAPAILQWSGYIING